MRDGVKRNNEQYYSCASWCDEVDEAVRRYKGDSLPARVGRVAMAAAVYSIWYERNQRIFASKCNSESQVIESISTLLSAKVCNWQVKRTYVNWLVCKNWGFDERMMY